MNIFEVFTDLAASSAYLAPVNLKATAPRQAGREANISETAKRGGFHKGAVAVPTSTNKVRLTMKAIRDLAVNNGPNGGAGFTSVVLAEVDGDGDWKYPNPVWDARVSHAQATRLVAAGFCSAVDVADLSRNVRLNFAGAEVFPFVILGAEYVAQKRALCQADADLTKLRYYRNAARKAANKAANILPAAATATAPAATVTDTGTTVVGVPYKAVAFALEGEEFVCSDDGSAYRHKEGRSFVYNADAIAVLTAKIDALKATRDGIVQGVRLAELSAWDSGFKGGVVAGATVAVTETVETEWHSTTDEEAIRFLAAHAVAEVK